MARNARRDRGNTETRDPSWRWMPSATVSCAVIDPNRLACCIVWLIPIRDRLTSDSSVMSRPSTATVPASTRSVPVISLNSVDLPAPFGPINACRRLVDEFDRRGKAAGAGFYDYPDGEHKRLWSGLADAFGRDGGLELSDEAAGEIQERLTFAMAIETLRCLEEGVLRSTPEANIGSIFGIGFPSMHGGAVQYVNTYRGRADNGPTAFLARAGELRDRYGDRFEPPGILVDKAGAGRRL